MLALCLFLSADAVSISTQPRVNAPDKPHVTVHVNEKLQAASLDLTRADGEKVHFEVPTKKGTYTFSLEQPAGPATAYDGALSATFDNGETGSIPLSFDAEVVSLLKVDTWASVAEIAAHHFHAKLNRPAGRVELALLGEGGQALGAKTVAFKGEAPGADLLVDWGDTAVPVLRIDATFFDRVGVPQKMQLFPWYVEIPHQDVNFVTAKYEIPKTEESKVLVIIPRMKAAAAKARGFVPVKLYVIGHTDTVGAADDNLRLSKYRARALAVFLRGHGVDIPVAYAGAGETLPLVPTPDNTDNASNRRAQYVISVDPPPLDKPVEWMNY